MKDKLASTENLTMGIWAEIEEDIKKLGAELYSVKVYESENNFVEYKGE
jgi:6-pyruvoyltetrahydropterin/6-carboxytetrahydropterin synthase